MTASYVPEFVNVAITRRYNGHRLAVTVHPEPCWAPRGVDVGGFAETPQDVMALARTQVRIFGTTPIMYLGKRYETADEVIDAIEKSRDQWARGAA